MHRKGLHKSTYEELNIKDMDDIQRFHSKSFVAGFALEGGLEAELDEELGCSSTIIATKTNNSRNGYSKDHKTSLETWI